MTSLQTRASHATRENQTTTDEPGDHVAQLDDALRSRKDDMVAFRRRLHSHPEQSGKEFETTKLVEETLRKQGLKPTVLDSGSGVYVDINLDASNDRFVCIRTELDCVSVNDEKTVSYASTQQGLTHACGHDAHCAMVLTAALSIHDLHQQLNKKGVQRNIRAIFQPAEETATGARQLIEHGVLDQVDAILALHVEPFADTGTILLRKGTMFSACRGFQVCVKGKSGHSARPFEAVDPIPAAINLIDLFYQLCPRILDSRHPLSLTVASFQAGQSYNAIPGEAILRGTLRAARMKDLDTVRDKMKDIVRGVADATGCEIDIDFNYFAPPAVNDNNLTELAADVAARIVGQSNVRWLEFPSMGAEDFAFYQQKIPGVMVRLGAGAPDKSHRHPLHSGLFDIDESALPIGAAYLAHSAIESAMSFTSSADQK